MILQSDTKLHLKCVLPSYACPLLSQHTVVWLGYLVYCVFVCTVTDFSAVEKDSVVKLMLSYSITTGMSFSHVGELWPRGGSPRSLNTRPRMRVPYGGICVLLRHLLDNFCLLLSVTK